MERGMKILLEARLGQTIISAYEWVTVETGAPSYTAVVTDDGARRTVTVTLDGKIKTPTAVKPSMYIAGGATYQDVRQADKIYIAETEDDAEELAKAGLSPAVTFGSYNYVNSSCVKILTRKTVVLLQREGHSETALKKSIAVIRAVTISIFTRLIADKSDIPTSIETEVEPVNSYDFCEFGRHGEIVSIVHERVADYIRKHYHIMILNNIPYYYDNGVYVADKRGLREGDRIREWIIDVLPEGWKRARIAQDIYLLLTLSSDIIRTDEEVNLQPKTYINFKNAYWDLKTKTEYPHDPKHYCLNQIPYKYNSKEKTDGKKIEELLDYMFYRPNEKEAFLEYIGYAMTTDVSLEKMIILRGLAGYGKSTILDIITKMFGGRKNCESVDIQKLNSDKFATARLYNKLANICNELPADCMDNINCTNALISGNMITCERKGKDAFPFIPYSRLMFSCNELPKIVGSTSRAFYRRLIIFEIDRKPEHDDPNLKKKIIAKEIPHFIELCVKAGERVYEGDNPKFTRYDDSEERITQYQADNDSVESFLTECATVTVTHDTADRASRGDIYDEYEQYCKDEGRTPKSKPQLYKTLREKGFQEIKAGNFRGFSGLIITKPANTTWVACPNGFNKVADKKSETVVDFKSKQDKEIEDLRRQLDEAKTLIEMYAQGVISGPVSQAY